jgi:type IV secretion system protein VirD4
MAAIDLGAALIAANGSQELDEVIANPVPWKKPSGEYYRVSFEGDEHVLLLGPTRSGKSRRIVLPAIVQNPTQSKVIVDIKGDLTRWSSQFIAEHADVAIIDPFGLLAKDKSLGISSIGYNPMQWLDPESPDFVDDCVQIAEAICPVESQRDPHFEQGAQDIVAGLIMYHRVVTPDAGLGAIRSDLSRTRKEWMDLLLGDENHVTKEGLPSVLAASELFDLPALWDKLAELQDYTAEDRELKAFIRSAKAQTRFLDSPQVRADLAKPGVDFTKLKSSRLVAYLVLEPGRLKTHARWLRLVLTGAINALRKTESVPGRPDTLMVIDEFAALGRLEDVEVGVALNASYGVKYFLISQAVTQLEEIYGKNFEIFTSSGALAAFGPRDPTTTAYLAKLSGERTIEVASSSLDHQGKSSTSVSQQRRENVMPHQFEQLGKGRMFVRLPSDSEGVARYITEVKDFTERADIPLDVRRLG